MSDIWIDKKVITIDKLGEDFLNAVSDDTPLSITEEGKVILIWSYTHF